jgi:catechol 2,3-dioxygenase-like lactoylglutathione lyase family enzyme
MQTITHFPQINILKPHIALFVNDIEKSKKFYQQLFGIEPVKVRTGYAKFDLEFPNLNLTLNQRNHTNETTLSHLGIQVESSEDVLKLQEYWQEIGLLIKEEKDVNCCFAIQDKAWVKDPDGHEWEVFVVKEDNLPEYNLNFGKQNSCSTQGCC